MNGKRETTARGLVLPASLGDEQDDIVNWKAFDSMLAGTHPTHNLPHLDTAGQLVDAAGNPVGSNGSYYKERLTPSGNDDTTLAQELLNDISTYHPGQSVYFDGDGATGPFNIGNLVIPNRAHAFGNPSEFTEVHLSDPSTDKVKMGTMFKRIHSGSYLNGTPMLRNDPDAAGRFVRNTSNVESGKNQVYDQWTWRDIWLDGNRLASARSPGLFEISRAWGFTMDRIVMTSAYGYSKFIDCNAFLLRKMISHYAPVFMFDCGDWQSDSPTIAGGFGQGTALWLHGKGMWQGLCTNLLVYNAGLNDRANIVNATEAGGTPLTGTAAQNARTIMRLVASVTGTDGSTDTNFAIESHKLEDGQPVLVYSTGSLPGRLMSKCVYWVRRVDPNTVRLCRTWNHYKSNTYIKCNSAGSGNIFIANGVLANLLLTGGARNNQFNAIRCDQSSGVGIMFIGSANNAVSCMVNSNGYVDGGGNTDGVGMLGLLPDFSGVPGIAMIEGEPEEISVGGQPYNSFIQTSENKINGIVNGEVVTGSGTTQSAQTVGVYADANTAAKIDKLEVFCVNHSTANFRPYRLCFDSRKVLPPVRQSSPVSITSTGNTDWKDVATTTVYAGAPGPNGQIEADVIIDATAGTNAKYFRLLLGNTVLWGGTSLTMSNTQRSLAFRGIIANVGAENSQVGLAVGAMNSPSATPVLTGTEDTSTQLTLKLQCAFAASETCNVRAMLTATVIKGN